MHMLISMPLAPYWDARACRRAFACVYYDMILEVERETELRKGRSRTWKGRGAVCAAPRCAIYSTLVIAVFAADA